MVPIKVITEDLEAEGLDNLDEILPSNSDEESLPNLVLEEYSAVSTLARYER